MRAWIGRFWPLKVLVILQVLFLLVPGIDLWISDLFYSPEQGFLLAGSSLPEQMGSLLSMLMVAMLLILPWLWLSSAYWVGKGERDLRRRLVFLFLVIVSVLAMLWVLSTESGRAVPALLDTYGGTAPFSGAFQPGAACDSDCAFVYTPAGLAFVLIAFAWVLQLRAPLAWGGISGAMVGLLGIAAGNAHLSDVLFAFWPVYGACLLLAWILLGSASIRRVS